MYGKIFESIYDGTLVEDWRALVTFQQMIVLCDADGTIDMTPSAISRRTGIPIEHIKAGIEILENPDPYSRTQGERGSRIKRLDDHRPWGWYIVNHEKYKMMADAETVRTQNRERKRRQRERGANDTNDVTVGHAPSRMSRHTDTDTDTDTDTEKPASLNESAWNDYMAHRQDIRAKRLTPKGEQMAMKKLAKLSAENQQSVVDLSISNGWQGIFPEKFNETNKRSHSKSFDELLEENQRRIDEGEPSVASDGKAIR